MSTSLSAAHCLNISHLRSKPISKNQVSSLASTLDFSFERPNFPRALKTGFDGTGSGREALGSDRLRRPFEPGKEYNDDASEMSGGDGGAWVDWEDQILEDTVPLVGFVRMILHSGKYESGDRLTPEHERTILERLLPYHPHAEKKIGCGINYITVGYHPNFERSRCLFIVREDGEMVDFSYWKCVKGLIKKNYPLYADTFIVRHFSRGRRDSM